MTNILVLSNIILTAYCACPKCCGKWADGITASGKPPAEGRTAACNFLPFNTTVHIPSLGMVRVIEDRMSRRYTNRIDIYFQSHKDALSFGIKSNITIRAQLGTDKAKKLGAYAKGTGKEAQGPGQEARPKR